MKWLLVLSILAVALVGTLARPEEILPNVAGSSDEIPQGNIATNLAFIVNHIKGLVMQNTGTLKQTAADTTTALNALVHDAIAAGNLPVDKTKAHAIIDRLVQASKDSWQTYLVASIHFLRSFEIKLRALPIPSEILDVAIRGLEKIVSLFEPKIAAGDADLASTIKNTYDKAIDDIDSLIANPGALTSAQVDDKITEILGKAEKIVNDRVDNSSDTFSGAVVKALGLITSAAAPAEDAAKLSDGRLAGILSQLLSTILSLLG